jgi:hypothetical protein
VGAFCRLPIPGPTHSPTVLTPALPSHTNCPHLGPPSNPISTPNSHPVSYAVCHYLAPIHDK